MGQADSQACLPLTVSSFRLNENSKEYFRQCFPLKTNSRGLKEGRTESIENSLKGIVWLRKSLRKWMGEEERKVIPQNVIWGKSASFDCGLIKL